MAFLLPVVYAPGGIDLRMPPTLRNAQNARAGQNFDILPSLHLAKRLGYQVKDENDVGYGLANYEKRVATSITVDGFGDFAFGLDEFGSPTTLGFGTIVNELVGIDDNPKRWVRAGFQLDYTGGTAATITIRANSGGYIELILTENGSSVYTKDLGTGLEVSPVTLSTVETEIDALTNWTATTPSAATSVPAAFLDFINGETVIASTPYQAYFGYWEAINTTLTTAVLPKVTERISLDDYENATTQSINGILYISNGYDEVRKYDGQNIYKAGLPKPNAPSAAVDTGTGVGGTFTGDWKYRVTYEQKDAVGNILESALSETFTAAIDNSAGPYAIDVTVTNLLASSGYNTNYAIVNGTQTSTNVATNQERLTVDDGSAGNHTMNIGDRAYFYDKNTTSYVDLEIIAVTGTTITVSSAATLSVDDNQPISNNLKINIWRAEEVASVEPALSDYKLIETIPNDASQSNQSYKDETIPANVGADYVPTLKTITEPPKGRYITTWRNQLILAGDPADPTKLYYSEFADVTNPENFPTSNFIEIPQGGGGRITGLVSSDRNLFVFLRNRIYVLEGNLAEDIARADLFSDNIGCVAHHTIQEIDGNIFFLSEKGVYRISRKGTSYGMDKVSMELDPILELGANNDYRDSYIRATAATWIAQNKYLLFMPSESTSGGTRYADSDSRVYVYDLDFGYWYEWENINGLGGMVEFNDGSDKDLIWFQTRESAANRLKRFNLTNSEIDYADHTDPVNMTYLPQWDFLKSPSTRKIYSDVGVDMFKDSALLPYDPSGTITLSTYRDFNDNSLETTFDIEMPSDAIQVVEPLPRRSVRSLGLKFSNNTINEQILITGWTLEAMNFDQQLRRR